MDPASVACIKARLKLRNGRSPTVLIDNLLNRYRVPTLTFLLFLLTAIAQSWPLVLNLSTHIPQGTEPSSTVPLFVFWTLRWNSLWLLGQVSGSYWDAPIFYPTEGTLALSGPQPITSLLFTGFVWPDVSPIVAYNLVFLVIQTLNGFAAWILANRLGIPTAPALLTGLLAQNLPFVGRELGVLQLTVLFTILMTLSALWDFHQQPRLNAALAIGGWTAVTFLTTSQYALFLSLFLCLGGILFAYRRHLQGRSISYLLAGGLLAGVMLAPVAPAQLRVTGAYERSDATVSRNSAQAPDYLRLNSYAWGANTMPWLELAKGGSGQRLYPGSGLLVLAGMGLFAGRKRIVGRRWLVFCAVGIVLAFILSLGPNFVIVAVSPYDLLRNTYPGFGQLRSPFRLALFTQIFLVGLAGPGVAMLWGWRHRLGKGFAILIILLGMLESLALPARLLPAVPAVEESPWMSWLGERPPGIVAMLPFPEDNSTASFEPTVLWMNQALSHGHKLVNGYSSFFPPSYHQLEEQMESFPDDESLSALEVIGVTHVVIDHDWLTVTTAHVLQEAPQLNLVYSDATKAIYQFRR